MFLFPRKPSRYFEGGQEIIILRDISNVAVERSSFHSNIYIRAWIENFVTPCKVYTS